MDKDKIKKIWKDVIPEDELEKSNPGSTYKSVTLEQGTIASLELPFMTITGGVAQNENMDEVQDTKSTASGGQQNFETALTFKYEDDTRRIGGYTTQTLNYELLDEIARGGMGVVFKGKQLSLRREVAIKKIKSPKEDLAKKDKFISESLVTAYLDHPNIVPVYDLGQNENEEVFLAMKLVGGTEWKNLLNPKTPQDKKLAAKYNTEDHLGILINVCNAVAYAHSKKIVHNDLKPSNVMVGEFGEVLVMDWGIAVDIRDHHERCEEAMTMHRSFVKSPMGTPHYMPWELAEGVGNKIGPWTDVYLLGGILYHILVKTPPHRGGTLEALVSAITGKLPSFPESIPKELQQICAKALSKEISQRYQSVSEFQKAIHGYLQHSESLVISAKARSLLDECLKVEQKVLQEKERNNIYAKFAQAVSGFEQALELWSGNEDAVHGQYEARLAYANLALVNEDFGLADAQIAPVTETAEIRNIKNEINNARIKKMQAQQATKTLRIMVYTALLVIIFGLAVGFVLVNRTQQELAKQKKTVEQQKDAIQHQKDAITEQLAAISLKKAEEAYQKSLLHEEEININSYMKQEKAYKECGAYAGKALSYINELQGFAHLQNKGRALVKLALQQRKEIWHSPAYLHRGVARSVNFTPDDKNIVAIYEDDKVQVWNVRTGKQIHKFAKYTNKATAMSFSADGQIVACGTGEYNEEKEAYQNCDIKLWNMHTGREMTNLGKHTMLVKHIVISKDGKYVFSRSDQEGRVWDVETGKQRFEIAGVSFAVFSDDGNILAGISQEKIVRLWDVRTGKVLLDLDGHSDVVSSIALSGDRTILASASQDHSIILWDIATGKQRTKIVGHTAAVNCVVFSDDGKSLASASSDKSIRLWDVATASELLHFKGHFDTVNALAFNSDSSILVSASRDHTLRLWNTATGKELSEIAGHTAAINSTAFSHDGKMLASAARDYTIKLWDAETGKELLHLKGHSDAVNSLAFSHRSKILASTSQDNTLILWSTTTGKELAKIRGHTAAINSVAFSHDGKTLASASTDGVVKLWNVETGKELLHLKDLKGHTDSVNTVTFSNDSKILASASSDTSVRLWDVATGEEVFVFTQHTHKVHCVAFSANDKMLVSSSGDEYGNDCAVKLWSWQEEKETINLVGHEYAVYSVAFHPSGKFVASGSYDTTVRLWNVATGKQISKITGHNDVVYTVAFSADGNKLVSGSKDQTLRVWDVHSTDSLLHIAASSKVNSVAFSSDGKIVASGSWDGTITLWDAVNGKNVANFVGHTGKVHCLAFSANGKFLASGAGIYDDDREEYRDCSVRLWSVATGKELAHCRGHSEPIKSVVFSPDGQVVVSGSWDNTIRLWDVATGKEISMLNGYAQNVRAIAFRPDGKTIASSWDNGVRLWDATTGKEYNTLHGHSDDVAALAFHPNGKMLASGGNDNTIKLWDTSTGKVLLTLTGHSSYILSIAFSGDGKILASGSWDNTIRLWDVATGKEFSKLVGHSQSINCVAFHPQGKILASGSWDNSIRLWNVNVDKALPHLFALEIGTNDVFENMLHKTPQELSKQLFGLQVNRNMELEPYFSQQYLWKPFAENFK